MLLIIMSSYFASGTGAAGIAGAFLWWEVRGLGVRVGMGVSSVRLHFSSSTTSSCSHMFLFQLMPSIIPLTYHFLLPTPSSFLASRGINTPSAYVPLATAEDDAEGVQEEELDVDDNREFGRQPDLRVEEQELMIDDSKGKTDPVSKKVSLSANDKWRLVKPLLARYMLPLCTFQFFTSGTLVLDFPFQCPTPLQRTKLTNLETDFSLCLSCACSIQSPCLRF